MASSTFDIGLSGLSAAQHGLTTTGHNIANVSTEGFSRQRVTFANREPQFIGAGFIGKSVDTQAVIRITNEFVVEQLRNASIGEARAGKMSELIDQIDAQFGTGLLSDAMQNFFDSVGDANDDPRVVASRQVLVENSRAMVSRLSDQEEQLNAVSRSVNRQIGGTVQNINALTQAIADLNIDIARGASLANGKLPNDLLDRREQVLLDLAQYVGVQVQKRGDGMINVSAGSGILIVTGGSSAQLTTVGNTLDASRSEVGLNVGGTVTSITSAINGGELGALVDFRDLSLDPARNAVGRLAVTLTLTVNAQHRQGMDLNGALGGDFFTIPPPQVNAAASNSGTISVAFDTANVGQLSTSDYVMRHDGANFILTKVPENSVQTLVGGGPFNIDGLTINLATAPAANDEYLIQPTKFIPRAMQLVTTDPSRLAIASPVRSTAALANISEAQVSRPEVLDSTNPALLTTTQVVFNDPPSTFQINGAGPLIAYSSDADIDVNGWRIQIGGVPDAGDTFTVMSNAGGSGDNTNGLALAQLQFASILAGGTASYQEAFGLAVGEIGAVAQQTRISHGALSTVRENTLQARNAISGVNLDEEAANLLRFQQAFEAAAQVIAAADATFESLINATRG